MVKIAEAQVTWPAHFREFITSLAPALPKASEAAAIGWESYKEWLLRREIRIRLTQSPGEGGGVVTEEGVQQFYDTQGLGTDCWSRQDAYGDLVGCL